MDEFPISQVLPFVATESVVPNIRRWVGLIMCRSGRPDLSADAQLVVSELVTNAVKAAPGKTIKVMVTRIGEHGVLSVWDPAPERPAVRADPLADLADDDVDGNGGRGLFLVASLAAEWGCRPAPDRGGKWVWARLS